MLCTDLDFAVESAEVLQFAASPHIIFKLRVSNRSAYAVQSVILKCQIQIEASRRQYTSAEQKGLSDLFGEPNRWNQTLRGLLWTNTSIIVPSFTDQATVDLPIPCTFDFNVSVTKFFAALEDGEIPIGFFFSGTVFCSSEEGVLQAHQISWEKEASFRLPIRIWREMMDRYYPNTAWLCLRRDAFERLYAYKVQHGIATFEQALEQAVEAASR